jgi:hypothetical protein
MMCFLVVLKLQLVLNGDSIGHQGDGELPHAVTDAKLDRDFRDVTRFL